VATVVEREGMTGVAALTSGDLKMRCQILAIANNDNRYHLHYVK
jgi:hypothetical protein